MSETSTPPLLPFDTAVIWEVISSAPYLTLSNLPSFWRTTSAPWGRIHSFPPPSVSSCNMGTLEAEENDTDVKLKPSKRIRPLSVPIQRYPSAVCPIALTAPPGNLLPVVHCSRTYCEGRRFGSSARVSFEKHTSPIPIRTHRNGFTAQITEDTRICRLRLHSRFLTGSDL